MGSDFARFCASITASEARYSLLNSFTKQKLIYCPVNAKKMHEISTRVNYNRIKIRRFSESFKNKKR